MTTKERQCKGCGLPMTRPADLCVGCEKDQGNEALAQLGARVLEILRAYYTKDALSTPSPYPLGHPARDNNDELLDAARSLGLLDSGVVELGLTRDAIRSTYRDAPNDTLRLRIAAHSLDCDTCEEGLDLASRPALGVVRDFVRVHWNCPGLLDEKGGAS